MVVSWLKGVVAGKEKRGERTYIGEMGLLAVNSLSGEGVGVAEWFFYIYELI